jgi:hypothetical protein
VFLTDTDIDLTDGRLAAAAFDKTGCTIAFVEKRQEAAFLEGLKAITDQPTDRTRVTGVNINSGRMLDIGVYARDR